MAEKYTQAQLAQIELEIRRRGLRDTLDFSSWLVKVRPTLQWDAPHLVYIRSHLDEVISGEIKKLMVFTPPRHGKSEQNTISFPAWYLERWPEKRVIVGAYNTELSENFSRACRRITRAQLSDERTAVNNWETVKGGGMKAVAVGSGVTGFGGNLILIDDPVRGRADADSEAFRKKCWEWYTNDLYTRLEPDGAVCCTMTRWHDDDLAGRILNSDDGKNWTVITLPAMADHNDPLGREYGAALWPDRYDIESLESTRAIIGPQHFNALYQQNPIPDEGDYFQRDKVNFYDMPPENLHVYGASDYAVTDGGGDFTEHGVFGIDSNDDLYILDWWSGQTAADVWIEKQLDLVRAWEPFFWVGEAGPIKRSIDPFLIKRARERKTYCRFEWLSSITDKATRARAFQARWAMGKVYLPKNKPWSDRLLAQLVRFPAATHDDAVDVCSLIGRALDDVHGATLPSPGRPNYKDRYDTKFADGYEDEGSGWKCV